MKHFLAWDCNHKSLEWTTFVINTNYASECARLLDTALKSTDLGAIRTIVSEVDQVTANALRQTGNGQFDIQQPDIERARALKAYLATIIIDPSTYVVIKQQNLNVGALKLMGINQQLLYHYSAHKVIIVADMARTRFWIGDGIPPVDKKARRSACSARIEACFGVTGPILHALAAYGKLK